MHVHFEMKTLMAYSSSNVEYADNYKKKKREITSFVYYTYQFNWILC